MVVNCATEVLGALNLAKHLAESNYLPVGYAIYLFAVQPELEILLKEIQEMNDSKHVCDAGTLPFREITDCEISSQDLEEFCAKEEEVVRSLQVLVSGKCPSCNNPRA
jgi:hypothetical protein